MFIFCHRFRNRRIANNKNENVALNDDEMLNDNNIRSRAEKIRVENSNDKFESFLKKILLLSHELNIAIKNSKRNKFIKLMN